jgi:hypothetical protein
MWKSISIFFGGIITGFLIYIKIKSPDITHVDGDLIESNKVKDQRKYKLTRRERRAIRKANKQSLKNK